MKPAAWPLFLPDLTLWHPWHAVRGTLPERWRGLDISGVCRSLGVPAWVLQKPWRTEMPGIGVREDRGERERTLQWETASAVLVSRWTLGPDGDWWQAEYPVKSSADLAAAREVAAARRYIMKPRPSEDERASAGEFAIELPLRPWSELFHAFLGWSEGLMLFLEEPEAIGAIAESLERSLRGLVESVASGPGTLVLSPDNLDGQFIAPHDFEARLAPSYRASADLLHARGKRLVVHVGGPVGRILPLLASCGIDCVEGICGPPQGDTTLAEARRLAGPGPTLWGGISQDFLLATHSPAELEKAARAAFEEAAEDGNAVVGVADKVPVDALPERLEALSRMAGAASLR